MSKRIVKRADSETIVAVNDLSASNLKVFFTDRLHYFVSYVGFYENSVASIDLVFIY